MSHGTIAATLSPDSRHGKLAGSTENDRHREGRRRRKSLGIDGLRGIAVARSSAVRQRNICAGRSRLKLTCNCGDKVLDDLSPSGDLTRGKG